jgi:hypothetical protein
MLALLKSKLVIGLVLVMIIGMFAYNLINSEVPVTQDESALSIGKDLLDISDRLSKAQLNQDVFTLPGYVFLTDFTVPIPTIPVGRANPFDALGR